MSIACFCTNGRKLLSKPFKDWPTLKLFHFPFLLFVVALVLFTPALFALSLVLYWHLAAQIILGIMLSLFVLVATVAIFLYLSQKKSQQKFVYSSKVKKEKENNEKCVFEIEKENNLGKEISTLSNIQKENDEKFVSEEIEKKDIFGMLQSNTDAFSKIKNVYSDIEGTDPIPDYMKKDMLNCDLN